MRGNEQKYMPDPRSRSPGLGSYGNMPPEYQNTNPTYPMNDRRAYGSPDFAMMNTGGGMPYQGGGNLNQNRYDRDYNQTSSYNPPTPQQYPMPDYRSNFDPNSRFVPQSKYLQEEMKKNNFGKDFNYNMPSTSNPQSMTQNYQSVGMPQPQHYDMKPEPQK